MKTYLKRVPFLGLCLALIHGAPSYAQSVNINANNTQQFISMMGGDMERSGRNFHAAGNPQDVIDWCVKDIPFNTWRVGYDKKQEMEEGVKNFGIYDSDVLAMQMIRDANPNIKFFATMESDYHGYSSGNRNNLPTFIYDYAYVGGVYVGSKSFNATKYGIFLADYVEYMEDQGVPLSYISISKEWVQVLNATRSKATIEVLKSELASRGVAIPQIIDACTWSISQGVSVANNYVANGANQDIFGYSAHNYWSGETKTWGDFATAANNAGKYAFADETSHGGGGFVAHGQEANFASALGAYREKCAIYAGGVHGECIFELWPRGYGEINNNGFYAKPIFFDGGSTAYRMRSYYLMKKFATNAVDRHYVNSSTWGMTDVATMAFKQGSDIAIWVINSGTTTYSSRPLNITNFGVMAGAEMEHTYWTATSNIEGVTQVISADATDKFTATIGSQSVNCFLIKGSSFTPDPAKKYYLDCPVHNLRIAATGESEDAYTTSTSTTGANVEWKFVDKGNGSWHLDRAAGGTKPRLRTDNSANADMQATSSSGSFTYYGFTEGASSGTHFLTLTDGPSSYRRLQVNSSGQVKMVTSNHSGSWESFTITEVSDEVVVNIIKRNAQGYAIDGGNGGVNGQNVYLWGYSASNVNQQWEEIDRGNGYFSYQKIGTNFSLDGGNGGANRQNVYLWTTNASNYNQHWQKVDMGGGYLQLRKRNSTGFGLNGGSGGSNGQNVNLYDSGNSSHNLQWKVESQ